MKLYFFPVAPNPTRVRLYLAEKARGGASIALEFELVSLIDGENRSEEFLAKNPLGKLPLLELDDGTYIPESHAIIEYIEELYPAPPMIGTNAEERLRVRSADRLTELGVLVPVAGIVHSTRSPLGLPANPAVAESCREKLAPGLLELDERLAGSEFVAGERVSIADCTLYAAACFGAIFGVEIGEAHPNVARWKAMFSARPSAALP